MTDKSMKTKNTAMKTTRIILSVVALTLFFVSCEKTVEDFGPADGRIILNASTSYVNSPETKTEYSGVDETGGVITSSSNYERIDWVAGNDIVRIICAQMLDRYNEPLGSADYRIGSPSADDQRSVAGASPVDQEMYWGTGDHYFYALYPAAGTRSNYHTSHTVTEAQSNIEPLSGNKAKITGSIPAEQAVVKSGNIYKPNMNYAYMYAAEKTAQTADGVSLHFYPLVTAFEFSLKALDDAMAAADLTSLKLSSSSTDMTGGFTATLDVDATTPATITKASSGLGRVITVTFPAGTRLSKTEYTVVTVLALGVDQTNLTLELNFGSGNDARTIMLKKSDNTSVSVSACKKVYMKLGVPNDAVFEVTPEVVFDWEGNLISPAAGATVLSSEKATGSALSWEIEGYYTQIDADGNVVPSSRIPAGQLVGGIPAWLTSVNNGNAGGPGTANQTTEPFPIVCPQQPADVTEVITPEAQALNDLVNIAPKGSAANPWNLSSPTGNKDIIESANSYIVNGPGWYKIPLVMGNGVKNNAINNLNEMVFNEDTQLYEVYVDDGDPDKQKYVGINYKGYPGNKQNDWRALFEDYTGAYVTDPHLHKSSAGAGTPTSAYIVWEDVEGLIETNTNGDYFLPAGCITYDSGTDCYWLNFHVASVRQGAGVILSPKSNTAGNEPRQGNAVIAIKDDGPDGGTTMWSYHIWLTDYKLGDDLNSFYEPIRVYKEDHTTLIVSVDARYELLPTYLGWTVYGQTITKSYHPNSVYVNFVQDITGATKVMKISQEDKVIVDERNRSHPNFEYGRPTPIVPTNGVNDMEPVWYGTAPSITTYPGLVDIDFSIKHPEFSIINTTGTQGHIIFNTNPIINPHNNYTPSTDRFSSAQNLASAFPPTNLWNAEYKFPAYVHYPGSLYILITSAVINKSSTDVLSFSFHNNNRRIAIKTVYDPSPAGFSIPPAVCSSEYYEEHAIYGTPPGYWIHQYYNHSAIFNNTDNPTFTFNINEGQSATYPITRLRSSRGLPLSTLLYRYFFVASYNMSINNSSIPTLPGMSYPAIADNVLSFSWNNSVFCPVIPVKEEAAPGLDAFPELITEFPYYYPPRP